MPTISKRNGRNARKNGNNWVAKVRIKGYPARSRSFHTRQEAARWGHDLEYAYINGMDPNLADPSNAAGYSRDDVPARTIDAGERTVHAALLIYAQIKAKTLARKTWVDNELPIVERWLKHPFSAQRIDQLFDDEVDVWLAGCVKERIPSETIKRRLAILARAIDVGIKRWRMNIRNPARGHRVKSNGGGRRRPTPGEKKALYHAAAASRGKKLYWAIRWAEECGMRAGEVAALDSSHLDFTSEPPVLTVPFAKSGTRSYYMWPQLLELYDEIKQVIGPGSLLFGGIKSNAISQAFGRIRDRLEISKAVTFHSLRYEANSWMVEAGVDKKLRMTIIGHVTDEMSEHYTQFSEVASGIMEKASASRARNEVAKPTEYISLDARTLERMVWTQPVKHIAAELGVSDVAVGKKCIRLGITKPPRGFWRQVECGERPHPRGMPQI